MKSSVKPKPTFQTPTLLAGVITLLIVFACAGYFFTLTEEAPADPISAERQQLETSRALWAKASAVDHSYVVERVCYCPADYREPYRVTRIGQSITFGYMRDTSDRGSSASAPPDPKSVDDLFDLLDRALNSADSMSVLYNRQHGFPETLSIDWVNEIADDELGFYVRDFTVLHQSGAQM